MAGNPQSLDVIIPVRGRPVWIQDCIASLAAQARPADCVTVIDDGMDDAAGVTALGVSSLGSRFRVIANSGSGISDAINEGVRRSTCFWIARMDADDISFPARFERQLGFLKVAPADAAGCGTQAAFINEQGRVLGHTRHPTHWKTLAGCLDRRNCFVHPTLILRRSCLLNTPYRRVFDGAEDIDLLLRLSERNRLVNLPDVLLGYRIHADQVSFADRPRQTALQELAIRVHRIRGNGGEDPIHARPGLVHEFVAWRMNSPEYVNTRGLLTGLRHASMYVRGADFAHALSILLRTFRCTDVSRISPKIIARVIMHAGAALVYEPTPFPLLNVPQ